MKIFIKTRSRDRDYYIKTIDNEEIQNIELEELERILNNSSYFMKTENNLICFKNRKILYIPKIHRNVNYRNVNFHVFIELDGEEKGVDIENFSKLLNENIYEELIEEKGKYEFLIKNFDIPFINKIDNYFSVNKGEVDSVKDCEKKNFFNKLKKVKQWKKLHKQLALTLSLLSIIMILGAVTCRVKINYCNKIYQLFMNEKNDSVSIKGNSLK